MNHNQLQGFLFYSLAIFLLACMDATAKTLTGSYPLSIILLFRSSFSLLPVALLYLHEARNRQQPSWKSSRPGIQILRGLLVGFTVITFFWSLRYLKLADATAISLLGPVIVVFLGVWLLKETLKFKQILALILGITGVLLIVDVSSAILATAALIALLSTVLYALASVTTKFVASLDSAFTTSLYTNLTMIVLALILVPFLGWQVPVGKDFMLFMVLGLTGGIGNILFVLAMQKTAVSEVAAIDYSIYLWAITLGFIVFDEIPSPVAVIGGVFILLSGLVLLLYHRFIADKSLTELIDKNP